MYSAFEFVCFRFENVEHRLSVDWIGCQNPRHKTFDESTKECFENILNISDQIY